MLIQLLNSRSVGKPEVMKPSGCLHVFGSDSVLYSHSKRLFTAVHVYKSRSSHTFFVHLALRSCSLGTMWVISVARITESVAARYGALPATTPMLATVSPFFIEGTAQTYRTTPLDGARASHTVLPNRSVT